MKPDNGPALLQLRILSGMHAGARAPLEGDEYTLGALDDCDFVLSDNGVQPCHARLSRREDGWQLDWLAADGEEPMLAPTRLVPGMAVPLGPVVVAVDDPQAPWPTLEQLVLVPHAPALEPNLPPPLEPAPARAGGVGSRLRASFARRALASTMTTATLGLSALGFVAWPMGVDGDAAPAAIAADAPPAAGQPDAAQRQAIDAALKQLGLAGRAKVEPAGTGWLVRAGVMSDVEGESLSAVLSRMQPRPALRMTTEQDLRDEVADTLVRLAPEYRGNISLRYMGEGRFRLEGRMKNAAERDKLLNALVTAFPQVPQWDNAVIAGEEAAGKLLAELRSHGWPIASQWDNGTLDMQVKLQQREVPQWERALLAALRNHRVPFRASLAYVYPPAAPERAQARLPFEIRSVVGGDMPYMLLPDGEKLAQGGTWQGWRLADIAADQVVFENGARRAVVQR